MIKIILTNKGSRVLFITDPVTSRGYELKIGQHLELYVEKNSQIVELSKTWSRDGLHILIDKEKSTVKEEPKDEPKEEPKPGRRPPVRKPKKPVLKV